MAAKTEVIPQQRQGLIEGPITEEQQCFGCVFRLAVKHDCLWFCHDFTAIFVQFFLKHSLLLNSAVMHLDAVACIHARF